MSTIKKIAQYILEKIRSFFKKYPEFLSIPMAIIIWIISVPLLRMIDPTSGIFDPGIFQIPIFAVLQLFIYVSMSWLLLRQVFGTQFKFIKFQFKDEFQNLTPWHKILIAYGVFFSLLFSLVALSYTLR